MNWPNAVLDTLEERKYLRGLLRAMPHSQPVVLIGSWARGTAISPSSDIDVLVLGEKEPASAPPRLQVIAVPPPEFQRRLMAGDDFPQWALRFGLPISGRAVWERLRAELLPKAPWPDAERKLQQAKRRHDTAETLLAMGDVAAAEEEVRFALSHVSRAELLLRNVFPLSRPELSRQLLDIGDTGLAGMMTRAGRREPMTKQEIRDALALVEKRLGMEALPVVTRPS
jgi:hypothetical protein